MDWEDMNWTMKDKGEEIFVFFELFCIVVFTITAIICKINDWRYSHDSNNKTR